MPRHSGRSDEARRELAAEREKAAFFFLVTMVLLAIGAIAGAAYLAFR